MFWLFCIKFTVTMLWTAISKKRVKLKEAVISQALPLSVKLPLVSLFGLGHSLTSSFCELNILLISKFSFLDDWFIAVASTSCVYPAGPRYIFLVLTSNNKSLSFWVYILVYFLMKEKFSCYFQMKNFLTSVEWIWFKICGKFCVCLCRDLFPMPKELFSFFWISAQNHFYFFWL